MIRLKHISGGNLSTLEDELKKVQSSITILAVNYVGTKWYIHFLVQADSMDSVITFKEVVQETVTKKVKR